MSNIEQMEQVMNRNSGFAILTIVVAGLSGCATMSGDECVTSDWAGIGFEDGVRGYTVDRISRYRKACAKHGVTPDLTAYLGGRDQGLLEYCQPNRGFNVGVRGGGYNGVCSVDLEPDFLDAYNAGYRLYALRADVNRATASINANENEQDRIEKRLISNGAALIATKTTQEERIILLAEMKDLAERTGQLDAEIKELYELRARAQIELDHYQLVVADMGY